jgi:hypothetical protein
LTAPTFWLALTMCAVAPVPAAAQGQLELSFHSVSGGVSLTGSGTNTATLAFGSVSAHGIVGPGVSRLDGTSDYTISTSFGVRVTKKGAGSNYTLRARLMAAHALAWRVNGVDLTTTHTSIAFSQPYDSIVAHNLEFVVPHSASAGAVSALIQVLAIAN